MNRRAFFRAGLAASIGTVLLVPGRRGQVPTPDSAEAATWRTFEVTTRVEIPDPAGASRVWIPLALTVDTEYHRNLGLDWCTNASITRPYQEPGDGTGLLYAEWAAGSAAPMIETTARVATRDRAVDPTRMAVAGAEEVWTEPTRLLPTDGIVRKAAQEITKGQRTDVDKARAIYEWVVAHACRDPKARSGGIGSIRGMLETGNLGGTCADLSAVFVGLARSVGIPARGVHGIRVADSAAHGSPGQSGDVTRAQHGWAEFHAAGLGWVPVDLADVGKVMLDENPGGLSLPNPMAHKVRASLFGAREMNWLAFNYAHDLKLPGSSGEPIPFFMHPQAEVGNERRDSLDPDGFRYTITARELSGRPGLEPRC